MISKRACEITSFIVMDVIERAQEMEREGVDLIHLEVGQPDFQTPKPVVDAAIRALKSGKTNYTHSLGIIELREAISEHYYNKYHVNISPEQIIITSGTSPALLLIFQTILEQGDQFILSNPYYPCYPNFVTGAGGEPIYVKLTEEEGFMYNSHKVKQAITSKTKGLLINSPANPTGAVLTKDKLIELSEINLPYIVSDEIYHGLTYTKRDREHTILEFSDQAIVVNGFSKTYAMTGWRLGYLIAPKKLIRTLQKLQQNYFISANHFVQYAGIAALKETDQEIIDMNDIYNKRRLYLIQRLKSFGFTLKAEPEGAFYVFVNIQSLTDDSKELAFSILEKAHVGVIPGIAFGSGGEGFLRISYANSLENIKKGLDRLEICFRDFDGRN